MSDHPNSLNKNKYNLPKNFLQQHSKESKNNEKKLIVGKDISLSGEIGLCDFLIIEGHVKAEIKKCYRLEVSSTGTFIGSTHVVEEAEIKGHFNGKLRAKHVTIRKTAKITDSRIDYESIQIDKGAEIEAEIKYSVKNEKN